MGNLDEEVQNKFSHLKEGEIILLENIRYFKEETNDEENFSKKLGSLGDISCFSLYPGKNLGAYGDAGIITTNNKIFYKKIKNFRNLGSDIKFIHM